MKQYKGYYIDHFIFNSKEEIDAHIENATLNRLRILCEIFYRDPSMECCVMMTEIENKLASEYGYSPAKIEDLEIEYAKAYESKIA